MNVFESMRKYQHMTLSLRQRNCLNQLIEWNTWKVFVYEGIGFGSFVKTNIKKFYEFNMFMLFCKFWEQIEIYTNLLSDGFRWKLPENFDYHTLTG